MVVAEIIKPVEKKSLNFPKLMVGKRTGTIYLALSQDYTNYGLKVNTIVIAPSAGSQQIGYNDEHLANLLEDFNGSITLRNEE